MLQRLKIWRELKRLEVRVREAPSPSTFVDLGQVYINLGLYDQTLRISDEGLALFPHSEELRKLHRYAMKHQLNGRIKDLRERLNRSPQPRLYEELAGLYLDLGDFGAVYGTCEEAIRRFPDDAGVFLVLARARMTNFFRDLRARDGLETVRCLEKVISLQPSNARAHKLFAETLYRIGGISSALHHLEILRDLTPDDPEVESLYREALSRPAVEEDLESLFHAVESTGTLAYGPVVRQKPSSAPPAAAPTNKVANIREALAQIAEIEGVRKAAYIKGNKALVKGKIRDGRDPFLRVARVVNRSAQRASRRLDIGNFSKGTVEGDFGHICLCSYGEVLASVLCDPGSPVDRVLDELQELVAGSLVANGAELK
jgi:tetratricopeptide (TPR) repeat protein